MKYRILGLLGVMALTAGSLLAQDYDDIYYDASKAPKTTKVKVETPVKTVAVYGEVPEKYKVVVKDNYREERDVDEYNRRGAYEPQYEVDINGDTIYMDSTYVDDDMFANTRRIERFYNPDVVILSDDDDLVELYYDESPTINLIVGSDYSYASYGWSSSYYPWYTGWYEPWYTGWGWYRPWYYSPWHYGWYTPYNYGLWYSGYWGWNNPWWSYSYGWHPYYHYGHWGWPGTHYYSDWGTHRPGGNHHFSNTYTDHRRGGLAPNRNGRSRVDASGSRNQVSSRRSGSSRSSGVGLPGSRNSSGGMSRSGNMGSRNSSGVSTRGGYSGGSRSSGYSGGSRSSGSYSGGSRSSSSSGSSRSYSSGSSHSSGSYSSGSSGGSRSSGGGGSHGGSSGGGGRRR